ISEDHAVVIAKAMHRLPERLDPAQGAEAERQLVALAHDYDPAALARLANCLLDALAPDTLDDDEDDAHRRRHLSLNHSTGRLHGRITPEALDQIAAMLEPLARPTRGAADGPDTRTRGQRLADALTEIARRVLTRGEWTPDTHRTRPHLTLITQLNPDH